MFKEEETKELLQRYIDWCDELKTECEELKKELHKNFEEKDKLHLIIDRLLEASGYDTNIASAEDFEDVYANMSYEKQQLDQLKAEIINRNEKIEELRFSVSDLTNRLCNLNAEKSFRIVDYKLALQEMKKIAEKILIECNHCDQYSCSGCPDENKEELAQQILQKCEVLNGNQ